MECSSYSWLGVVFLSLLQVLLQVKAKPITISCPSSFQVGQDNVITCTINSTAISSTGCQVPFESIQYEIGLAAAPGCLPSPAYPPTNCSTEMSGPCGCKSDTAGIYVYFYKYRGSIADNGKQLKCYLGCGLGSVPSGACTINFPASPQPSSPPPAKEDETADVSGNVNLGVIIGCSLAAGTAVLFLTLYICRRQRSPSDSPGVEMAPIAGVPDVNQPPAQPVQVEQDAESGASSAFDESSVADGESTVG